VKHNTKFYGICMAVIFMQVIIDFIASYAAELGKWLSD